jgi:hypothetical protein
MLIVLMVVVSEAFLGFETFTESVLTWTGADNNYIGCRVVLSELVLIGLLFIIILLIRLCFHEHVSILLGVSLIILYHLSSILMQD